VAWLQRTVRINQAGRRLLAVHDNKVHCFGRANFRFIWWIVMAGLRGLCVLALALPLAGCFSVTAPKEVPSWAMSPQGGSAEQSRVKVSRRAPPQRVVRQEADSVDVPTMTGNAAMPTNGVQPDRAFARPRPPARPTTTTGSPTAFSPEWHAREDAADEQLRRRMNICNGC
jgi:hypothetical protein